MDNDKGGSTAVASVDGTGEQLARRYLELTKLQMDAALRNRAIYVNLARKNAMTDAAIAEVLDVDENVVRWIPGAS